MRRRRPPGGRTGRKRQLAVTRPNKLADAAHPNRMAWPRRTSGHRLVPRLSFGWLGSPPPPPTDRLRSGLTASVVSGLQLRTGNGAARRHRAALPTVTASPVSQNDWTGTHSAAVELAGSGQLTLRRSSLPPVLPCLLRRAPALLASASIHAKSGNVWREQPKTSPDASSPSLRT